MKEPWLGGHVSEVMSSRIRTVLKHGHHLDRYAGIIAITAGIDMLTDEGNERGVEEALTTWVTDVSPEGLGKSASALNSAKERTCDPRLVRAVIGHGVNPYAMYMLSAVADCTVDVDLGGMEDGQVYLQPVEDDHDELGVPLAPTLYWAGDRLLIRRESLPETLAQAIVGRTADRITDHPAVRGLRIVGVEETQGHFVSIGLESSERVPWACTIEEILRDLAAPDQVERIPG